MQMHDVTVHPSKAHLPREEQLAWKHRRRRRRPGRGPRRNRGDDRQPRHRQRRRRHRQRQPPPLHVRARHGARPPACAGRAKAPPSSAWPDSTRVSPEWAAWANGTAVRELDMHDTFLAADYSHPGDNIPPMLAVAQSLGKSGAELLRGLATGYEIHIDLVRAICLHEHKIDHIAHLCPAQAAGIGTMLRLDTATIYQAVQQAVHVSFTTRQSRKGEISSWKAYAPAHAGKLAIEAVDRVMRGEGAPSPIYEGEDSVIAWMLDGPKAHYQVPLPAPGRGQARHPRQLHQGTFRRIPEPGADRPRLPHGQAGQELGRRRGSRHRDQPPHPLRHRHRRQRPAEDGPEGQPRDARPLHHVHRRRRPAGRRMAPRPLLRAGARRARRHGPPLAQDPHRRGPEMDRALPRPPARGPRLRRPHHHPHEGRQRRSPTRWRSPTRTRSAPRRGSGRTTSRSSSA